MTGFRDLAAALCAGLLLSACTSPPVPDARVTPPAGPLASASPSAPPSAPPPAAPSAVSGPSTYLALGDSVAAGVGAASPNTGGYVPLLAGLLSERLGCAAAPAPGCPLELRNLAVSGATTATLIRDQLPQARALLRTSPDVRLLTLTIGCNDVFEPVARTCAPAPQDAAWSESVVTSLRRADDGIDEVLRLLTASVGSGTTVAVMAYYDPLGACRLAPLQALAGHVLEGTTQAPGLNDILRARAAQHWVLVVETREGLSGRGDFVGGNDCLHPSGQGHARIAEAFVDVVGDPLTRP